VTRSEETSASGAQGAGASLPECKLAYRVPEACAAIGYKRSKLYELIKAGRLAIKKDGACTIIMRAELERYLNSLPSGT
jgi:excisionase family DNA binding protein